ncbi:hypothetical protein PN36_12000 [Candidatus Thiomargarita nelsonii]|uniref:Uncharacterized protein n=1 Tax=Candidatus Thiomargarita nelsonii TaxID=1003181 RepID=A0A4E0RJ00_9GAMM|nr:hypothetical protein PN36_12000 [Candidatus Thiomargarita nelsonii]
MFCLAALTSYREWSYADFPKLGQSYVLFREWSYADFPKLGQSYVLCFVSGMELRGFPETRKIFVLQK